MTSKYRGWSHTEQELFRGLSLYHQTLPIIIVNDSDARKAQSFTLLHELGHLLRGETIIDSWQEIDKKEEQWCDRLAGNVLMPADNSVFNQEFNNLHEIKKIAKQLKVSPYACLVRLKQLEKITQKSYTSI